MTPESDNSIGKVIQDARRKARLSQNQLAARVGLNRSTVMRLERGDVATPNFQTVMQLAHGLGLNQADVAAIAGYLVPSELPDFAAYLRTKYPDLSTSAIAELVRHFMKLRNSGQNRSASEAKGA